MPVTCVCGSILKDERGLRKHKRLHCKVARLPEQEARVFCPECDMGYPTQQALSQHRRHAHIVNYNLDMEAEARGARKFWTEEEERQLAAHEIRLRDNPSIYNINLALSQEMNRTADAIKKRRQKESYRNILARLEAETAQSSPVACNVGIDNIVSNVAGTSGLEFDSVTSVAPNSVSFPGVGEVIGNLPSTSTGLRRGVDLNPMNSTVHMGQSSPIANGTHFMASIDVVAEHLLSLTFNEDYNKFSREILEILDGVHPADLVLRILADIPSKTAAKRKKGDKSNKSNNKSVASRLHAAPTTDRVKQAGGKTGNKKKMSSHSNKRAFEYKKWQELFKKDRRALAAMLIDSHNPDENLQHPNREEVECEYRKIFNSASPPDNIPFVPVDYGPDNTYAPITREDILRTIRDTKSSAPGPDGVDLSVVKNINVCELEVLFNVMLYCGYIPEVLKACRTTLIPKSGDLTNVSNWRPITITSLLLRLFNKILARRLGDISINCSQKGFRSIDGGMVNVLLLQSLIKEHRSKIQPYNIATIDLKKAFDSVSIHSIPRALRRVGVHDKTVRLIENMYLDCSTIVSCCGEKTNRIEITRGVRQGDPLSPAIFNLIMDELLCSVNHDLGLPLGSCKISLLAYADDLVVLGPSLLETQRTLDVVSSFLQDRGLAVNALKCTALSSDRVPKKKKLFVYTEPQLKISGLDIPPVTPSQHFRYLGRNFDYSGLVKLDLTQLKTTLSSLQKSPLKPQQKLFLLAQYILPKALASLQYPSITANTLRECDTLIRVCVKSFLHIPQTTANSFLYARARDGGLGLFQLEHSVPLIVLGRMNKLSLSTDPLALSAVSCSQATYIFARLAKISKDFISTRDLKNKQAISLEGSYSGNGLSQGNYDNVSSFWVHNPPRYWSGKDYVRAIQLRSNMLPTVGIPSNPKEARRCRAGCFRNESLSHVLQGCPCTHWERINRHDRVVKQLKTSVVKSGFAVEVEPRIRCSNGTLRKPDLVISKGNDLIISDVGVYWEGPRSLNVAYGNKCGYYGEEGFIAGVRKRYGDKNILLAPCIVGARGTWCRLNKTLVSAIGLSLTDQRTIITDVLKGGWTIHSAFNRRVWSRKYIRRPAIISN